MERLFRFAEREGITISFVDDLDPAHPGRYNDDRRHADILDGMNPVTTLCVLGHELGHAKYRDVPTMFMHIDQKQERRADEWAAHFLIDNREYRLAEEKFGTRTDWIAQELGVLERLVIAYERTLRRIGDHVYVNPKMGAGQWARRVSA